MHFFVVKIILVIGQDDIALVICMVILMSLTGGIVMFKVNMMAVMTTGNGSLQDASSEILIQ